MKRVEMAEMTVEEVRRYLRRKQTIILPYGVVEQHGYHLPLDTDIRNATFLGRRLAERLGCLAAPTLTYCFSGGQLPGTINVRPATFATMIGEIVESLVMQGFRDVLVLPGHGGSESLALLKESLRIFKWTNDAARDAMILLVEAWRFSPTWMEAFHNRDYHAGEIETSLILHWSPEVVRARRALDARPIAEMLREDPDSYQDRSRLSSSEMEIVTTRQDARVKVGVMGYPERASAETGARVEKEFLDNAAKAIRTALAEAARNRKAGKRLPVDDTERLKILS